MCGRFTITMDADDVREQLELSSLPVDWRPRYNVAPTQPVGVVADAHTRQVEWMRWGLIPSWAKDMQIGNRLINARSETVNEKPSFRQAFASRRCVILADGFYEWQRPEGKSGASIPYYFRLIDRKPFGFAGLWETWRTPEGEILKTCAILTTEANERVAPVHNRMPVILRGADLWRWILPAQPDVHLSMLKPLPQNVMESYTVSRKVNAPGNDIIDCILPASL